MKKALTSVIALSAVLAMSAAMFAQGQGAPAKAPAPPMDGARTVAGGGIFAPGWTGKIDANEEAAGQKLENAKFTARGNAFDVSTGPATNYWNPANRATGDYTVKATFTEPKFQNLNNHPHPYGIFIAGNDLGTPNQKLLYCATYGTGVFIVRGFAPAAFQMNGRRGEPNAAVAKAAGVGQPVKQDIAMSVKGNQVTCSVNGTVVGTYEKAALATNGIATTDGIYGIRFAHNTEGTVEGFAMTKP
jgi:hypothetical protein